MPGVSDPTGRPSHDRNDASAIARSTATCIVWTGALTPVSSSTANAASQCQHADPADRLRARGGCPVEQLRPAGPGDDVHDHACRSEHRVGYRHVGAEIVPNGSRVHQDLRPDRRGVGDLTAVSGSEIAGQGPSLTSDRANRARRSCCGQARMQRRGPLRRSRARPLSSRRASTFPAGPRRLRSSPN